MSASRRVSEEPPGPATGFSDDLFRAWASTALIGVFIVQNGLFAWVNDHMQRDLGYGAGELVGQAPMKLIHPDDRVLVRAQTVSMLQGALRSPYEYRYVTRQGEVRWALETVASAPFRGERAVLGNFMDITVRKQAETRLAHQAFHDALTGLPNRALLIDRLTRALARRDRRPGEAAVLYLDLDGFKTVNDSYGHHAGDALLTAAARRLVSNVRPSDTVARLGGDEFAVLLEEIPNAASALRVAEKLVQVLRWPFIVTGHQVLISASIGVALSAAHEGVPDDLLREADAALYQAKARGKSCAVLAAATHCPDVNDSPAA